MAIVKSELMFILTWEITLVAAISVLYERGLSKVCINAWAWAVK